MFQREHLDFIDWIRGCAAFLVLVQHTCEGMFPAFKVWTLSTLSLGMSGVVAFFLVSGWIIAHSHRGKPTSTFLWNRFFRIFPLYWVILLLGLSSHAIFQDETLSFGAVIAHVALIHDYLGVPSCVGGGTWTLLLELTFYILFILWRQQLKLHNRWTIPLFSLGVLTLLITFGIISGHRIPLGRPLLVLAALQSALWYFERSFSVLVVQGTLIGAGLIWFAFKIQSPLFSSACILASWGLGYCLFWCIPRLVAHAKPVARVLAWMGKISYSVYLGQAIVLMWMTHLQLPNFALILAIPITYLFAWILYWSVEYPGIKMGKYLANKKLFAQ